jgi:hypothetical protein
MEARVSIIYTSAVHIDQFPALVSAFVPLVKNDRTGRVAVIFDLRNAFESSVEKEIELRQLVNELVDRTLGVSVDRSSSTSVSESVL